MMKTKTIKWSKLTDPRTRATVFVAHLDGKHLASVHRFCRDYNPWLSQHMRIEYIVVVHGSKLADDNNAKFDNLKDAKSFVASINN